MDTSVFPQNTLAYCTTVKVTAVKFLNSGSLERHGKLWVKIFSEKVLFVSFVFLLLEQKFELGKKKGTFHSPNALSTNKHFITHTPGHIQS